MTAFVNAMKAHLMGAVQQFAQPRYGIVTEYHPDSDTVKLRLEPESTAAGVPVESGWLPVAQPAAGAGYGVTASPVPGMQAVAIPANGDSEHLIVVGFAHNDTAPPAKVANAIGSGGTPSSGQVVRVAGEVHIVHKSGSVIRMCDNGDIYMHAASGNVGIDASLHVNGDLFDRHGSLDRLRVAYDAHRHPGVQPGGGITGTTDHVDPE